MADIKKEEITNLNPNLTDKDPDELKTEDLENVAGGLGVGFEDSDCTCDNGASFSCETYD